MELNKHIKLMYKLPVEVVFLRSINVMEMFDFLSCGYFKDLFEFCLYAEIVCNPFTMHIFTCRQ